MVRLRLTNNSTAKTRVRSPAFDETFDVRKKEADEFYATVIPQNLSTDAKNVMRQAFAGMLWSKQFYHYVVKQWLEGDPGNPPPPPERREWPQSRLASSIQRRRNLHARQMGISLVRGLGLSLPLHSAGSG